MKLTILTDDVIVQYPAAAIEALRAAVPGVVISCIPRESVKTADLIESEIIFGWPPQNALKELTRLKWLHLPSAGANNFTDISMFADPSIILTKSSGTFGVPISEHVLGMMIALSRNFPLHYNAQQKGEWGRDRPEALELFGSNVLILGLGDIGTEVCKRLSGFGCNITGIRRDPSVLHEFASAVLPVSQLRESLPNADYIVICLPGTAETSKLIGYEEFALMKKRAIIINIGRGTVIDTDALVDALKNHKIGGAGVDVTDPEPLPAGHPLWNAGNVLITPHVSALSPLSADRRLAIFTDLLKRYLSGQKMYNVVDFVSGY